MGLVQSSGKQIVDDSALDTWTFHAPANFTVGNTVIIPMMTWRNDNSPVTSVVVAGTNATMDARNTSDALNWPQIWRCVVVNAGRDDVVVHATGDSHYLTLSADEWDNIVTDSSPVDGTPGTNEGGPTSNPTVSGTGSTSVGNTIVYAAFIDVVGETAITSVDAPSGWTNSFSEVLGDGHEAGTASYVHLTAPAIPVATWHTNGHSVTGYTAFLIAYKVKEASPVTHGFAYDFIGTDAGPVTTPTFDTPASGAMMVACVGRGIRADFATATVSDNKGNGNYSKIEEHAYTGYPDSGTALYAKSITGGTGTTVNTTKPSGSDEVTLMAVSCPSVNTIVDKDWSEDFTSPNTSASVTLTDDGILVAFWAGDDFNGDLGPTISGDWELLDHTSSVASNHVQMASAAMAAGPGTYTAEWTPTTPQGAQLWIVALQQTAGDVTAPELSVPTSEPTDATTATHTFATDEGNGTAYSIALNSATPPSKAQIKAGHNASDGATEWSGSLAITSTGTKTFNATGLHTNAKRWFHTFHEDAAGNQSAIVTSPPFTSNAPGAVDFGLNNESRYYQRATNTAFNFPDADWSVGIAFRLQRVITNQYGYLFSIGDYDNNGYFQIGIGAPGSGDGLANKMFAVGRDSDGTLIGSDLPQGGSYTYMVSNASPALGVNYLAIIQRRSGTVEMHMAEYGTTISAADKTWSATTNGYGARVSTQDAFIGARGDVGSDRFFENPMAEFFLLNDSSLSIAEINTLLAGAHIAAIRPTRALDLRFRGLNATEPDLSGNGRDFTRHGSGIVLASSFFPDAVSTLQKGPNALFAMGLF